MNRVATAPAKRKADGALPPVTTGDPEAVAPTAGFFEPPRFWQNGSGLFTVPEDGSPRREIGRVYREAQGWRVLEWTPLGYLDLGTVAGELEGMARLPRPSWGPSPAAVLVADKVSDGAKPVRGRRKA